MYRIKKGDIVGRISYGKDILFTVENIINRRDGKKIAILKGIILRIEADADIEDLAVIDKKQIEDDVRSLENKIEDNIRRCVKRKNYKKDNYKRRNLFRDIEEENGKILHLEGDIRIIYTPLKVAWELDFKRLKIRKNVYHSLNCRKEFICLD